MSKIEINMKNSIPIFRIFDEEKAKNFYLDFLGFNLDWEHRFEEDLPIYMQISCGNCIIHLSEHHGDCSPGAAIRVEVDHIKNLHTELISKKYKYARPGLDQANNEICVKDPFSNQITFYESQ